MYLSGKIASVEKIRVFYGETNENGGSVDYALIGADEIPSNELDRLEANKEKVDQIGKAAYKNQIQDQQEATQMLDQQMNFIDPISLHQENQNLENIRNDKNQESTDTYKLYEEWLKKWEGLSNSGSLEEKQFVREMSQYSRDIKGVTINPLLVTEISQKVTERRHKLIEKYINQTSLETQKQLVQNIKEDDPLGSLFFEKGDSFSVNIFQYYQSNPDKSPNSEIGAFNRVSEVLIQLASKRCDIKNIDEIKINLGNVQKQNEDKIDEEWKKKLALNQHKDQILSALTQSRDADPSLLDTYTEITIALKPDIQKSLQGDISKEECLNFIDTLINQSSDRIEIEALNEVKRRIDAGEKRSEEMQLKQVQEFEVQRLEKQVLVSSDVTNNLSQSERTAASVGDMNTSGNITLNTVTLQSGTLDTRVSGVENLTDVRAIRIDTKNENTYVPPLEQASELRTLSTDAHTDVVKRGEVFRQGYDTLKSSVDTGISRYDDQVKEARKGDPGALARHISFNQVVGSDANLFTNSAPPFATRRDLSFDEMTRRLDARNKLQSAMDAPDMRQKLIDAYKAYSDPEKLKTFPVKQQQLVAKMSLEERKNFADHAEERADAYMSQRRVITQTGSYLDEAEIALFKSRDILAKIEDQKDVSGDRADLARLLEQDARHNPPDLLTSQSLSTMSLLGKLQDRQKARIDTQSGATIEVTKITEKSSVVQIHNADGTLSYFDENVDPKKLETLITLSRMPIIGTLFAHNSYAQVERAYALTGKEYSADRIGNFIFDRLITKLPEEQKKQIQEITHMNLDQPNLLLHALSDRTLGTQVEKILVDQGIMDVNHSIKKLG